MGEKQTIYIVTEGTYSDYRIAAIFSTKASAELFIERENDEWFTERRVEEYQLDRFEQQIHERLESYYVIMYRDGQCYASRDIDAFDRGHPLEIDKNNALAGHVLAESKEHAAKIAAEHRAQLIATNQW